MKRRNSYLMAFFLLGVFCQQIAAARDCEDEEEARNAKASVPTRALITTSFTAAGGWLVEGLALNTLHKISQRNGSFLGFYLSAKFFEANKKPIGVTGRVVGAFVGGIAAEVFLDKLIPAQRYINGCWNRCIISLWEWDGSKSSKRDRVVVGATALAGIALFYNRSRVSAYLFA